VALSLTDVDTQYNTSWPGWNGRIKENFRALSQCDSDVWQGQNLSGYGSAGSAMFTLYGSSGGLNYETLEIGSNRTDSDATRTASIVFFANQQSASHKAIAAIDVYTDGATANQRGGQIRWMLKGNGTTTVSEVFRIDSSGNFGLGGTNASYKMHVAGHIHSTSNIVVDAGNYVDFNSNGTGSSRYAANASGAALNFYAASNTARFFVDSNGNFVIGSAALATNATNGFLYIPTCAGTPTGMPAAFAGRVPVQYDTTNNKMYVYNSGWKSATFA
jgi:hypothetical protein